MLLSSLFLIFSLLLGFASYFFLRGKAAVFFPRQSQEKVEKAQRISTFYGISFLFCAICAILLMFYHPVKLALLFLGIVVTLILVLVVQLNFMLSGKK
ncbi:hypothetical protein [Pisciglobus halotolerans]|uniref:DUF3784 domain-containing protein n=1 Tax=Pisciglobus halotolerans TaxID=745365 RepID=A0A1I3DE05_9LACT|nr:hypothetical protein [Pisciglobus halotolerans]SFH84955.1 hypothetical protein SAMN04489868_1353 [Pisciglobus halotolerans]